jgi:chorismate-pyruvate lyase
VPIELAHQSIQSDELKRIVMNTKTTLSTPILRSDLQESLNRSHIDPAALTTFQRILLTTDGTVTDMLEAYLCEPIQLIKLSEELVHTDYYIQPMELQEGSEVVERKILLRGRISRKNYLYAESIVVLDRLEDSFRNELVNTKTPIGKLWFEKRVETFKEIIDSGKSPAQELSQYFNIEPEENLFYRTYCVLSNKKYTMMITEKFPESYFRK